MPRWIIYFSIILLFLNILIWNEIFFGDDKNFPSLYFLDIGQGDSSLIAMPAGTNFLIDGGPDAKIIQRLDETLGSFSRSVDLIVLSHPQADHFGGLIEVMQRYRVGAIVFTGAKNSSPAFEEFQKMAGFKKIPVINLGKGDKILYGETSFLVLSPDKKIIMDKDPNNTSLVIKMEYASTSALFTGDITSAAETELISGNIDSDILKVAHHGSRFSSAKEFLKAVSPSVAVISAGKNSYGHPNPETLERLKNAGARIIRTDINGTVRIDLEPKKLHIFSQR